MHQLQKIPILIVLLAFFGIALQQPSAQAYANAGFSAEQHMELSRANTWFSEASSQDAAWDLPWHELAYIALLQQRLLVAQYDIHQAILRSPANADNWVLASKIAMTAHNQTPAIADAEQAFQVHPQNATLNYLATVLLQTGSNAPLLALLRHMHIHDAALVLMYGIALLHNDEPSLAMTQFSLLANTSKLKTTYLDLARHWQSMSVDAFALFNADIANGLFQEACIPLTILLRNMPADPAQIVAVAWGEWVMGQTTRALDLAQHIPNATDQEVGLHAIIALAAGQPQVAMAMIMLRAQSQGSLTPSLQLLLADAAQAGHQYGIAENALMTLTNSASGPDRIHMLKRLATFYLTTGLGDDTGRMPVIIQQLSTVQPLTSDIWDIMGQWHQHIGNLVLALADFQSAIHADAANIDAYQHLAALEQQIGDATANTLTTSIFQGLQE